MVLVQHKMTLGSLKSAWRKNTQDKRVEIRENAKVLDVNTIR